MAQTTTVDGVDRSSVVYREDTSWAESAYLGETGEGRVVFHDDAGTITAAGFKDVVTDQDACDPPRIFTGFVGKKAIKKGDHYVDYGVSREYAFTTRDGNDLLSRLFILQDSGNRSHMTDDTVAKTLVWLVADELSRVEVLDHGAIDYVTTVGIDAVDRRGTKPGDVLSQLAKSARRNYYVRWHFADPACPVHGVDDTDSWELVFREDNISTEDTSTIAISNAGDDDGETVFAPDVDPELSEDPEHVYSREVVNWAKGREVVERAATATAFVERDGDMEDSAVKHASTANRDGVTALWEAHTEEQSLPVTLTMRADQVNLILPGHRVPVRMVHMTPEGWNPARYARVLRRKVRQPQGTDSRYKVDLDLSPQEAARPAGVILQSAFGWVGEGGGYLTLPNPVTPGSDLIFCIGDRDGENPVAPSTDPSRSRWGPGGWTKKPNVTAGQRTDGVAIWRKVADTTERTGYVAATNAIIGIYEVAGVDWASATTASKDEQASAATMDIGSLGSPAVASVNIMVGLWFDGVQYNTGTGMYDPDPSYAPRTGWTLDKFDASFHGSTISWQAPLIYIAHAIGTGAALTAGGTRSPLYNEDGRWGGAAISMPPA